MVINSCNFLDSIFFNYYNLFHYFTLYIKIFTQVYYLFTTNQLKWILDKKFLNTLGITKRNCLLYPTKKHCTFPRVNNGIHLYSFMYVLYGLRYLPHVIKRTIQAKWLHYGCRAQIRETWIIHLSGVSCLITGDWTVASCSLQIGWKFSSTCFFRRILIKRVRFRVLKPFYMATKHQCANIRKHRTTACKMG